MTGLLAIIALAAAPITVAPEAPQRAGVQITVSVQAEVIRAGTSGPDEAAEAPRRQIRPRPGGRSTVEFE